MSGHREPSGEEIARRAHELYLQRGGEHMQLTVWWFIGLRPSRTKT
jgi:hypothetical protein